jgi:hypothetical protein
MWGRASFFLLKKKNSQEYPEKDNLNILLACWKGADRECKAQVKRFLGWAQGQSRKQRAAGRKFIERESDVDWTSCVSTWPTPLVARDSSNLVRGRRKLYSKYVAGLQLVGNIYRRERYCATALKPVSR